MEKRFTREYLFAENMLKIKQLQGNGDFRSSECIEYLKEADIVITNPPFSLFREYVAQLMEYGKKFIIIGNTGAINYKEIFKYVKDNELWVGASNFNVGMHFTLPDSYTDYKYIDKNGKKIGRVSCVCWWTNIENKRRNEELDLYKKYNEIEYPKFDNIDAINVNNYTEIPADYDGLMGVPTTFIGHYNPTQFEIVDLINRYLVFDYFGKNEQVREKHSHSCNVNGKSTYIRLLIRRIRSLE